MKPHAVEMAALGLLCVAVTVAVVGPFYYNSVVMGQEQRQGRIFYVTAREWVFQPDKFVVKKGERVTFVITSEDVVHGFSIEGYNAQAVVLPGEPTRLTIVANMTGTFNIICFVDCGQPFPNSGMGHMQMNATLTVLG